jgi:demethylmenaquinone methyltransferase/2-methoxy-6-polyprenyl-1,4-benzoquinol methylase
MVNEQTDAMIASPDAAGNIASPHAAGTVDFGYTQVPEDQKAGRVREVFASVAAKYDVMNDLMSMGVHRLWKREFCAALDPRPGRTLLDLAGGIGDITFGWLARGGGPAVLSDINEAMLARGQARALKDAYLADISFLLADAEALPLPDMQFDRVSMAFGLRNCTHKDRVIAQARRVLKPGGRFFILEFSKLQISAMERLYDTWSFEALPRIGRLVAGDADSYRYLAESIRMFPDQDSLAQMMVDAGLERVGYRNLSGGIAAIHWGWRL